MLSSTPDRIASGPSEPLRFRPIFKEKIWGGRRMETVLRKRLPGDGPYGECWEISSFGADQSVVVGGSWDGRDLAGLVAEFPEGVLGRAGSAFPLLFKTIDASAPLSVQLHPAEADPPGSGPPAKTEAWIILDTPPGGAKIVHGLVAGADRNELLLAAEARDAETVERLLGWKTVQAGDVVFLPSGTIHAIGAGILLLEVQQSSDSTYRIHDWGRPGLDGKPRELHIKEARQVEEPAAEVSCPYGTMEGLGPEECPLVECPLFKIHGFRLEGKAPALRLSTRQGDRSGFLVLGGVKGSARVHALHGGPGQTLRPGEFILIPAAAGDLLVETEDHFTGLGVREGGKTGP